jgi:hypothetical protein
MRLCKYDRDAEDSPLVRLKLVERPTGDVVLAVVNEKGERQATLLTISREGHIIMAVEVPRNLGFELTETSAVMVV